MTVLAPSRCWHLSGRTTFREQLIFDQDSRSALVRDYRLR